MSDHDAERLTALRSFGILDTASDVRFDDVVELAASICGTAMAAVSLVDEHRQWFKARVGLAIQQTPIEEAFCAYTITQRGVLEVRDAHLDERFARSPLVVGEPHLRFYAAAPLVTADNHAIGTVCVLDTSPRQLDGRQRSALQALARQAMALIVLHHQALLTQRAEHRFRAVVEQTSDLIVLIDAEQAITYISPAVRDVLGYDPQDAALRDVSILAADQAARQALIAALSSSPGASFEIPELHLRHADCSRVVLQVRVTNLIDDPAVRAIVFNARDVTEVRRAEGALDVARRQALLVLETANDSYIQVDADERITDWNRRAADVFGWEKNEVLGRHLADVIVPDRHRDAHVRGFAAAVARSDTGDSRTLIEGFEVTALRRDGSELPVEVTLWSTATPESGLRVSSFVRDITDRRALENRLAYDAIHDDLTGLPNRQLLHDRLEVALGRIERDGGQVGVLFCDLDQFKIVNNSSGHSVGDQVLVQIAQRLTETVRATDTVVRFGGDEFVVVVDGVDDPLEVADVADRILDRLSEPVVVDGHDIPTSVSIGYAVAGAGAQAERLVSDADAAMYLAKERGRNRVEPFGAELQARVLTRLDDERALRRALDQQQLVMHYQPIVSLPDGRVRGAEALVRWNRPGHGLVLPGSFIPLAEETGLIVDIGDWVLDAALAELRAWGDEHPGRHVTMSVNISAHQLNSDRLAETVAAAIERTGVDPSTVTLELTESTLLEDLQRSVSSLEELRQVGVNLAIDDFGTGYSSLAYLKSLPIDTVKIDRSFVMNLGRDPYDSAIVSAVSSIGQVLGLEVIAEGVETAEQAAQVLAHGCHVAQGYLFGAGMPGHDLAARLTRDGDDLTGVS